MISKKSQYIFTFLLSIVSCLIAGIILFSSYYIIFFLPNQTNTELQTINDQTFSKIASIDSNQISLYSNNYETFNININQVEKVEKFDPYTYENETIDITDLKISDHVVTLYNNQNYNIILVPPHSIIGVITELSPEKIIVISQYDQYEFTINQKTIFISPDKREIFYENLSIGNMVSIYSNYPNSENNKEVPTAASIQVTI